MLHAVYICSFFFCNSVTLVTFDILLCLTPGYFTLSSARRSSMSRKSVSEGLKYNLVNQLSHVDTLTPDDFPRQRGKSVTEGVNGFNYANIFIFSDSCKITKSQPFLLSFLRTLPNYVGCKYNLLFNYGNLHTQIFASASYSKRPTSYSKASYSIIASQDKTVRSISNMRHEIYAGPQFPVFM